MVIPNSHKDKSTTSNNGRAMQPFIGNSDTNDATLPRTQMTIPVPPPPYTAFPYGNASTGGTCGGKKSQGTRYNARGVAFTIIFLLFAILNAVLERDILTLGFLSLKNVLLLALLVTLYLGPIISFLSLMLAPSCVFSWVVLCAYISYALISVFVLIMNLVRANLLLYNYLASMICSLCLTVIWCRGPSAPSSWMPIVFVTPASSAAPSV